MGKRRGLNATAIKIKVLCWRGIVLKLFGFMKITRAFLCFASGQVDSLNRV